MHQHCFLSCIILKEIISYEMLCMSTFQLNPGRYILVLDLSLYIQKVT